MPKRGGRRKKNRTHVVENETAASSLASQAALKVPRSLVVRRGKVETEVIELVADLRKLMSPFTALNFKEDAKNRKMTLAHYAKELTGTLGVTHLVAISQNGSRLNLRLARTPAGPTLTFKLKQFSLVKQVRSVQRRPYDSPSAYSHPPIVVTNNFGDVTAAPHVKLMRITFQNMFPAVNVATVKLSNCRRVVLFNFLRRDIEPADGATIVDADEDEEVEIRHYAIKATPVGVDRKVRRIIQARIPNLSRLDDVADYITGQTTSGNQLQPPHREPCQIRKRRTRLLMWYCLKSTPGGAMPNRRSRLSSWWSSDLGFVSSLPRWSEALHQATSCITHM